MSKEIKRPDPDELLSAITHEEARTKGGKLKIFVGMAAGVGKTYAMLEEAQQRHKEGVDVAVGIVNTHGRQETAKLLEGLEVIPEKWVNYKDTVFEELDLDAILARKPQLILVDELAHTNVPGSRHPKRWQDILEILDAGIDVYTTLNVQHIESRKEIVEKIAGVPIRETVPDSIVERASQIKLIDISPPELLQRLKEGKVYLGPQSEIAAKHFFQEDCLMALREIVLRFTAEKVDHDLHDILATTEKTKIWMPRDKILVSFSQSPHSQHLIRTARRIAFALDAPWIAVHVDTGKKNSPQEKLQLSKNIALAQELGAEVVTTSDVDVTSALNRLIKSKKVTQVILGRPAKRPLGEYFGSNLVDRLAKENPEVDIHVTSLEPEKPPQEAKPLSFRFVTGPSSYFKTLLYILVLTLLNHWLVPYVGYQTIGFIYLLGIMALSLFTGIGPVIFGTTLSVLIWNLIFVNKYGPQHQTEPENIAFFIAFILTALFSVILIRRIRHREDMLRRREENNQAIYEIVRIIATYPSTGDIFKAITSRLDILLNGETRIIIKSSRDGLDFTKYHAADLDEKERAVANWVYNNNKSAGWSTETLSGVDYLFIPLKGYKETVGVLTFKPKSTKQGFLPEEQNLLYTVGQQLANYLERTFAEEKARKTEYDQQIEKVQRTILDTISLEFRNPLLEIEEAAEEIMAETQEATEKGLSRSVRLIEDSSKSLRHTFDNILAMSQLNSGFLTLQKKLTNLKRLIDSCLNNLKRSLIHHKVDVKISSKVPQVPLDFSLMELALCNLILNAIDYTPQGGCIKIISDQEGDFVWVSVIDEGPGVPEEIIEFVFEKFYRGPDATTMGVGLGLAIVKTIMEMHDGYVEVVKRMERGGEFRIYIPKTDNPEPFKGHKAREIGF